MMLDRGNGEQFSPLRADQLQTWLNKVLNESMTVYEKDTCDHAKMTPLQYFGLDRSTLSRYSVDKRLQDRIYRTLFVYSTGIHQVMRECTTPDTEKVVSYALWRAYLRVLEFCDPCHTQLLLGAHETEQGEFLMSIIDNYKTQTQKLTVQSQYFHDLLEDTQKELEEKTRQFDDLTAASDTLKRDTDAIKSSLQQSFYEERTARAVAESTFEQLREQIADLTRSNHYLEEKVRILREGMHTSMDESYRFQESSKLYFQNATDLSALLQLNESKCAELTSKLESEFKQRMEYSDKCSSLQFTLQQREDERNTLTNDVVLVSKLYRSVADCLGACLATIPQILTYVDSMETWKNSVVLSIDVDSHDTMRSSFESVALLHNFSNLKEANEYFGVGSAYSNNKDKFIDNAKHISELSHDLQSLTRLNRDHLTNVCSLIEKNKTECETLRPLIWADMEAIDRLAVDKAAAQVMSEVYLANLVKYQASTTVAGEELEFIRSQYERLYHTHAATVDKLEVSNKVEVSLRAEIETLNATIDQINNDLLEATIAFKSSQHVVEQQELQIEALEKSVSSLSKEISQGKDFLSKAESMIFTLKDDLSDAQDMCKGITKNNLNIVSIFPILERELSTVLSILDDACRTCTAHGIQLPSSDSSSSSNHQRAAVLHHIHTVRHLSGLTSSDQHTIIHILECIARLVSSAGLFNFIGAQAIELSATNVELRADINKYLIYIDRERKRTADIMHYATDMETFSKGLLQGQQGTDHMSSILTTAGERERTQNAIIEAKELYKREHETRIRERDHFEQIQDQLKQSIQGLEKQVAYYIAHKDKSLLKMVNVATQTDYLDCSSCRELNGKVLRLSMELDREKNKVCEACEVHKEESSRLHLEVNTLKAGYSRSQLLQESMNAQIESLIRECEELKVRGPAGGSVSAAAGVGAGVAGGLPPRRSVMMASTMASQLAAAAAAGIDVPSTNTSVTASPVRAGRNSVYFANDHQNNLSHPESGNGGPSTGSKHRVFNLRSAVAFTDVIDDNDSSVSDNDVDHDSSKAGNSTSRFQGVGSEKQPPHSMMMMRSESAGDAIVSGGPELSSLFTSTTREVDGIPHPHILTNKWKQLRMDFMATRVNSIMTNSPTTPNSSASPPTTAPSNKATSSSKGAPASGTGTGTGQAGVKKPTTPSRIMSPNATNSPLKQNRPKLPVAALGLNI